MSLRVRTATLAAIGLSLVFAGSAQAAVTVANTNDSGPGSLRQVLAEATPGETVNLPAGTYTLTSESIFVEKSVTIAGQGADSTVLRSGGPFRVLFSIPPGMERINVSLTDLTIRDGFASEGGEGTGGGIFTVNTNLTLERDVVTANRSFASGAPGESGGTALGGGLMVVNGAFLARETTISGNAVEAVGGSGDEGGETSGAGAIVIGHFRIENSTISGNQADARGGQGPSSVEQGGGTTAGVGFYGVATEAGADSTILSSTIAENSGDTSGGPGGEGGEGVGGGAYLVNVNNSIALTNTTVADNSLRSSGNGTDSLGGGLFAVAGPNASQTVTSSTIAANRLEGATPGSSGGNLFFASTTPNSLRFANTIVSGGVGPVGSENCFTLPETFVSLGFNLDSTDQCGFHAAGDKVITDPLLGPLGANGGLGATMVPSPSSPAVDQGSAPGLGTDERGVGRPIDLPSIPNGPGSDGSDIGAVELQPSNALKLGKLKKNRKKGTATLIVTLPAPSAGVLVLEGKGLKTQTKTIAGETTLKLKVVPKGKIRKALRKRGKRKVGIKATYTPTGNAAATATRKAKLVKKKPKKRRKKR